MMTTNDWITKLEAKIFDADMEAAIRSAYDGLANNGGIYEKTEQACARNKHFLALFQRSRQIRLPDTGNVPLHKCTAYQSMALPLV